MPAVLTDVYTRALATVDYGGRMALKIEQLLDEVIQTLRVIRPVASTLAQALDDGVVDDVLTGIQQLQAATEVLGTATATLERVAPVAGLVGSGIGQVNNLPGVKQVRRRLTPRDDAQLELEA